jgi:hypothetical protein
MRLCTTILMPIRQKWASIRVLCKTSEALMDRASTKIHAGEVKRQVSKLVVLLRTLLHT